jgi:hypothetical protein
MNSIVRHSQSIRARSSRPTISAETMVRTRNANAFRRTIGALTPRANGTSRESSRIYLCMITAGFVIILFWMLGTPISEHCSHDKGTRDFVSVGGDRTACRTGILS